MPGCGYSLGMEWAATIIRWFGGFSSVVGREEVRGKRARKVVTIGRKKSIALVKG